MVPTSQGADLGSSPFEGPLRNLVGVGPGEAALRLDEVEVLRVAEAPADEPASPLPEDLLKLLLAEAHVLALASHPRGDEAVEGIGQLPLAGEEILQGEMGGQKAYPTVDVKSHASRAHHPPFLGVEGRHPPDGEAVAPVDVGHGQGGFHDPRQGGHVHELLQGSVVFPPRGPSKSPPRRRKSHPPASSPGGGCGRCRGRFSQSAWRPPCVGPPGQATQSKRPGFRARAYP